MRSLALALILLSTPAQAHCYTHWAYPYPQRCNARVAEVRKTYALAQPTMVKSRPKPERETAPTKSTPPARLSPIFTAPVDIPDIPVDIPDIPGDPEHIAAMAVLKTKLSDLNLH